MASIVHLGNDIDHGWAWVVLFGVGVMSAISDGFRNCSGIFYSEFIDTMNLSRARAASIVALMNAMFFLPGPIAALCADKIGTRPTIILGAFLTAAGLFTSAFVRSYWALLVTFGGLTGFGLCLSFMSAMGAISHWFIKYRQFVLALWSAAGALGIFAMAPFIQLLVDVYSWRGATIVLAGVCLNITLTGMAYFPVKDTGPGRPARALGDRKSIHKLLFSNAAYLFHLANSFFMFGMPLFLIFIVRHATRHRGLTSQEGALLVSICGVTSFLGRVMFMLINLVQVLATKEVRFYLFNFSSLFGAVACAIVPIFWNFYAVAVVCGVMGFMQGVKLSTMMNVTMDITSPPRFQIGFGYFSLAVGISVLTVPPFAGYLAETFLSYDPVFYLCGAALVLSFIFGTLSQIYEKKRSHRLKAFEDISIRQRNPQEKSQTEIPS